MRRPLSIMRANPEQGWLDFLYKPIGHGLEVLGQRVRGDSVSVLGRSATVSLPIPPSPRSSPSAAEWAFHPWFSWPNA